MKSSMTARAVARAASIALLALLGGPLIASCTSLPQPPAVQGSRAQNAACVVLTDRDDPILAREVAAAAHGYHEVLQRYFSQAPTDPLTIVVFASRDAFERNLPRSHADARARLGGYYEPRGRFAVVHWPESERGQAHLCHEIVHHFVAVLLPQLPDWKNEGLACALSHYPGIVRRRYGWIVRDGREPVWGVVGTEGTSCPVSSVRTMPDDQVRRSLRSLEEFGEGPGGYDYAVRQFLGAVVHFGLATAIWPDVRELASWEPSAEEFIRWLRSGAADRHDKFPPLAP